MKVKPITSDEPATERGSANGSEPETNQEAISPLGRRLREIRARIVASGVPLLNWEELEREIAERRGGVRWDDE